MKQANFIEPLDYETLLTKSKERFLSSLPADQQDVWRDRLTFESEVVVKILEHTAYLEMLLRTRINETAKQTLLAYAKGTNLDYLADFMGISRKIVQEENTKANPPQVLIMEDDKSLKKRVRLALNRLSNAGTKNAYINHSINADQRVKDVVVRTRGGGVVEVHILAKSEVLQDEESEIVQRVKEHLHKDTIRPLCDTVEVSMIEKVRVDVTATLVLYPQAIAHLEQQEAMRRVTNYLTAAPIGCDISIANLISTLNSDAIQEIELTTPARIVTINEVQKATAGNINITTQQERA